jgi:hypothetical protein
MAPFLLDSLSLETTEVLQWVRHEFPSVIVFMHEWF